jgi:uncharacterized protein YecT (DUF1311 family)
LAELGLTHTFTWPRPYALFMAIKLISIFAGLLIGSCTYAPGHIDHIKNQAYLKYKDKVDCNKLQDDNLSEKICANLAFQKSDSLLVLVYDSLLNKVQPNPVNSFTARLTKLQAAWRKFRDDHCTIIYDSYKNCGICHVRSIAYLNCLKALTDDRIKQLRELYARVVQE